MGQLTLVFSIEKRSYEITIIACPICPKRKVVVKCGISVLPVTGRAVRISAVTFQAGQRRGVSYVKTRNQRGN